MRKIFILTVFCIALLSGCGKNISPDLPETNTPAYDAFSAGGISQTTESITYPADEIPGNTPFEPDSGCVEIKEKMFIAQTNDIYINADEYLGKTIKYEGIFGSYTLEETTYCMVYRYGPGCCGTDGNAGFEVIWDNEYPKDDEWVEVVGTLESYEENGYNYLRLNLSSLTVLTERGAEYVAQ